MNFIGHAQVSISAPPPPGAPPMNAEDAGLPRSQPLRARLVHADPSMVPVMEVARCAARGQGNILVLGETGVGKEVMARTLHALSGRASKPLVCVDCAALSDSLVESELFGHRRGAFTGATEDRIGLLESAQHGTVFLDEIGELPARMQAKLLRVLESREIVRLGEVGRRQLDVRFIAATNRELAREVEAGLFRRDLFFRLSGFTIRLPPLRERAADIVPLAETFLADLAVALGIRPAPVLSPRAMIRLCEHDWPGNVRELRSAIERAIVACKGSEIDPEDLVWDNGPALPPPRVPAAVLRPVDVAPSTRAAEPAADQRQAIEEALAACAGNQSRAAKVLGISRNTLLARLAKHGISRPRTPRA